MAPRKHIVLVASCMGLCWAGPAGTAGVARAAVYVVDSAAPGAADTNPGSEEKPFKTVQHAADVARPGDTVYVMAGKYHERIKVKTSGAEGRPIKFQAMPRRSATRVCTLSRRSCGSWGSIWTARRTYRSMASRW